MRSVKYLCAAFAVSVAMFAVVGFAQQDGPYKILKKARVGGLGGWDYIYADSAGRRLYIPRHGFDTGIPTRVTVFNLDTLEPVGEIPGVGGNGTAVDPKSGHGFTTTKPITMFDTKTLKVIKTIDVGPKVDPDGIYFDPSTERAYILSHPTQDVTVIDTKEGKLVGSIDLGGPPEQAVGDGKGKLYVTLMLHPSGVAVVDLKAMKTIKHYSFGDHTICEGMAMDVKNQVLFATCSASGDPPNAPAPVVIIINAQNGKILQTMTTPAGSDGAIFNPETMEAIIPHGEGSMSFIKETSPTTFELEQELPTMNSARTITFDSKTGRLFMMSEEGLPPIHPTFGPGPPMPPQAPGTPRRNPFFAGNPVPGSFTIMMIGK